MASAESSTVIVNGLDLGPQVDSSLVGLVAPRAVRVRRLARSERVPERIPGRVRVEAGKRRPCLSRSFSIRGGG